VPELTKFELFSPFPSRKWRETDFSSGFHANIGMKRKNILISISEMTEKIQFTSKLARKHEEEFNSCRFRNGNNEKNAKKGLVEATRLAKNRRLTKWKPPRDNDLRGYLVLRT
jgi:hypothetical protein